MALKRINKELTDLGRYVIHFSLLTFHLRLSHDAAESIVISGTQLPWWGDWERGYETETFPGPNVDNIPIVGKCDACS